MGLGVLTLLLGRFNLWVLMAQYMGFRDEALRRPLVSFQASSVLAAVEDWAQGIAHNYTGPELLRDQRYGFRTWLRSPAWAVVVLVPPLLFLATLTVTTSRSKSGKTSCVTRDANSTPPMIIVALPDTA